MLRLLLVLIVLGTAVYLTVRLAQGGGLADLKPKPRSPRPPSRPQGPDDDEDFLRDLDRRRLHPEDPDSRPET